MFRKFVALLTVFSVCLSASNAVRCYLCTTCQKPFVPTSSLIRSSCTQCQIAQSIFDNEVQSETRGCVSACTPQDNVKFGNGGRVACCSTDLCNEKYNTSDRRFPSNFALLGLITTSLWKIQL